MCGEPRGEVGGWTTTRAETRYGCFLPDLTGLARRPSIANLPGHYIDDRKRNSNPSGHARRRAICRRKSGFGGCAAGRSAGLRIAEQVLPDVGAVATLLPGGDQIAGGVVPDLARDLALHGEMPRLDPAFRQVEHLRALVQDGDGA